MRFVLLMLIFGICLPPVHAQEGSPLEYLQEINESYQPVLRKQLDFARSLAQGQPGDLVKRQRTSLLNEIRDAQSYIDDMPPHRGNTALRESMVKFLSISYDVVNEDYARLVNMERISEESYDKMEAFLRAQEQAYVRMSEAARAMKRAEEDFAHDFGVRLVNSDDRFARQLNDLNETFTYYNEIYLIFFNAYQQELLAFRAIESQQADKMEMERRKLEASAKDGLVRLERTGAYKGDRSLRNAATKNLQFYLNEAQTDIPPIVSYYEDLVALKQARASLDNSTDPEQRSELTSKYNELVRRINTMGQDLNPIIERLNRVRAEQLNEWNRVSEAFLRKYID